MDEQKQREALLEKDANNLALEVDNCKDFKVKYAREAEEREDLATRYMGINDELVKKAAEY